MRYTTFGRRSGLRVSEFALGTGNFGTSWSSGTDAAEARIIFDRFAQAAVRSWTPPTCIKRESPRSFSETSLQQTAIISSSRRNTVRATQPSHTSRRQEVDERT